MSELWNTLRHNKRWWLTPIVVLIILFGILALFSNDVTSTYMYRLM